VHAIGRSKHQHREAGEQHCEQRGEMPTVHAAEKQHGERARGNHHQRAEIRLAQQQPRHDEHHREHGQQAAFEAFQHAVLAHGVVGGVEHGGELHQLRGLHAHQRQREPAPRAVDLTTDSRNQDRDEQCHAAEEQKRRGLLPVSCGHQEHQQRRRQRHGEEHRVAREEPRRAIAGVAVRLGSRDGRGVDHHEPRRGEQQCRPGERTVVLGGGRIAPGHEGPVHGSARTAAANTSPRSW
jgi:hypothetical protein